jgi:hypothetical protein
MPSRRTATLRRWIGRARGPAAAVPPVPSSELLGYAPDARVLIVNADDLGMCHAINVAVIDRLDRARHRQLVPPDGAMPVAVARYWAAPATTADPIRDPPHAGLCRRRWGPMTPKEKVPSLLDGTGALVTPGEAAQLLARARHDEVELEFRAQIDAVVNARLTPTHLDFHCLADGGREDILDLTVALASEYGLAVRVWLAAGSCGGEDCRSSIGRSWTASPSTWTANRPDTPSSCVSFQSVSANGPCIPVSATRSHRPSTAAGACSERATSSSPRRGPAHSSRRRGSS